MPKTPAGAKRPADVTQNAVHVMRIATGQESDTPAPKSVAEESGSKGGKMRAEKLTRKKRTEIAKKAAASRWAKK